MPLTKESILRQGLGYGEPQPEKLSNKVNDTVLAAALAAALTPPSASESLTGYLKALKKFSETNGTPSEKLEQLNALEDTCKALTGDDLQSSVFFKPTSPNTLNVKDLQTRIRAMKYLAIADVFEPLENAHIEMNKKNVKVLNIKLETENVILKNTQDALNKSQEKTMSQIRMSLSTELDGVKSKVKELFGDVNTPKAPTNLLEADAAIEHAIGLIHLAGSMKESMVASQLRLDAFIKLAEIIRNSCEKYMSPEQKQRLMSAEQLFKSMADQLIGQYAEVKKDAKYLVSESNLNGKSVDDIKALQEQLTNDGKIGKKMQTAIDFGYDNNLNAQKGVPEAKNAAQDAITAANSALEDALKAAHDHAAAAQAAAEEATRKAAEEATKDELLNGALGEIQVILSSATEVHKDNAHHREGPKAKSEQDLVSALEKLEAEIVEHNESLKALGEINAPEELSAEQKGEIEGAKKAAVTAIKGFITITEGAIKSIKAQQGVNKKVRDAIGAANNEIKSNNPKGEEELATLQQYVSNLKTAQNTFTEAVGATQSSPDLTKDVGNTKNALTEAIEKAEAALDAAKENQKAEEGLLEKLNEISTKLEKLNVSELGDLSKKNYSKGDDSLTRLLEATDTLSNEYNALHEQYESLTQSAQIEGNATLEQRAGEIEGKFEEIISVLSDNQVKLEKEINQRNTRVFHAFNGALDAAIINYDVQMADAPLAAPAENARMADGLFSEGGKIDQMIVALEGQADTDDSATIEELNKELEGLKKDLELRRSFFMNLNLIDPKYPTLNEFDEYIKIEHPNELIPSATETVNNNISNITALIERIDALQLTLKQQAPKIENPDATKIADLLKTNPKIVARHNSDIFREIMMMSENDQQKVFESLKDKSGYVSVQVKGKDRTLMLPKAINNYEDMLAMHGEQLKAYVDHKDKKQSSRSGNGELRTFYAYVKLLSEVDNEIKNHASGTPVRSKDFDGLHQALLKRTSEVKESYYLAQAMGGWSKVLDVNPEMQREFAAQARQQGFSGVTQENRASIADLSSIPAAAATVGGPAAPAPAIKKDPSRSPVLLTTTYGVKDTVEQKDDGRVRMKMYADDNAVTNDNIVDWWNTNSDDLVIEYDKQQFVVTAKVVGEGKDQRVDFYMRKYEADKGHSHHPDDIPFSTEHTKDRTIADAIRDRLSENVNANLNAVCLKTGTDVGTEDPNLRKRPGV